MLIYWMLFGIIGTGALLNETWRLGSRWLFILLVSVPTILMIALRWEIGPDWAPYLEIFGYTERYSLSQSITHSDPGFFFLMWVLHKLAASFWIENLVCGTVFIAGLTAFCKRQPNPWLTFIVAFPYLVIVIGMSGNRQSIALGLLFFSLIAFERQRAIWFALLTVFAALFHASVILMLPIGLLSFTRSAGRRTLLLIVGFAAAYYLLGHTFNLYARRYSMDRIQSSGIWFRIAMNALPAIIFLQFQKHFAFEEHMRVLWRNLSILSLAVMPLVFVIPSSTAIDRLILYFFPLQFAVLSRLPYSSGGDRRSVGTTILGVVTYAAAIQFVFLNFGKFSNYYIPYKTIPILAGIS